MYNPFLRSKAELIIRYRDIADLFCRNHVWDLVREPVNQIVYGCPGSGKSMLLKRLSMKSMIYKEEFLEDRKFIGTYVQISKLAESFSAQFHSLRSGVEKVPPVRYLQRLFEHYFVVRVVYGLIDNLMEIARKEGKEIDNRKIIGDLSHLLNPNIKNLRDLLDFLSTEKARVERYLNSVPFRGKPCECQFDIHNSLDTFASDCIKVYNSLFGEDVYVYLLLDASQTLPEECQGIINIALQRGYNFFTKLAVRYYDWSTFDVLEGRKLEGSDFYLLCLEYPVEKEREYRNLMFMIVNTLVNDAITRRREGWQNLGKSSKEITRSLFKENNYYTGFDNLCELVSGNIWAFLHMIYEMFENTISQGLNPIEGIPSEIQEESIIRFSNSVIQPLEEERKRGMNQILTDMHEANKKGNIVEVKLPPKKGVSMSLFEDEVLPCKKGDNTFEYLKSFFTDGYFKLKEEDTTNLINLRLPNVFMISKLFLPLGELGLRGNDRAQINYASLKRFATLFIRKRKKRIEPTKEELEAFLATSLKDTTLNNEQRKAIKETLQQHEIKVYDWEDLNIEEYTIDTVVKYIYEYDFTLTDITDLTPNTCLEMGLCAGLDKVIICIFNKDSGRKIEDLPVWVREFSIVPYGFSEQELDSQAKKTKGDYYSIKKGEPFRRTSAGSSFRLKAQDRTLYLSYPKQRKIWEKVCPSIETKFSGYTIITEEHAIIDAKESQRPIYCGSAAEYAIVDTTKLELLQCYNLGVCIGLRILKAKGRRRTKTPYTLRIEEQGESDPGRLMFQSPYKTWRDGDHLCTLIENFIKRAEGQS